VSATCVCPLNVETGQADWVLNLEFSGPDQTAANLAGGKEGLVGYLKTQAELVNPSAFMTGLSKLLPSVLEGNPDAPLIVERVYYTRDVD
jgi:hypothetical protein